jgi:hypothetical protein
MITIKKFIFIMREYYLYKKECQLENKKLYEYMSLEIYINFAMFT